MESEAAPIRLVRSRRLAREAALQALYQVEVGHCDLNAAIEAALEERPIHEDSSRFAIELADGVKDHESELDAAFSVHLSPAWTLDRMPVVDRLVLRIATFELLFLEDMPPKVTVDQAVTLAKRFSTADSGRFVNGVLAGVLRDSHKSNWTPPETSTPQDDDEDLPIEEPIEEVVTEGTEEYDELKRTLPWVIRKEDS